MTYTAGSEIFNWAHKALQLSWKPGKERIRSGKKFAFEFLRKLNDSNNKISEVGAHGHCHWKIYNKPWFRGKQTKIRPGKPEYPEENPLSAEIGDVE